MCPRVVRWPSSTALVAIAIAATIACTAAPARAETGNEALALKSFEAGRRFYEAHSYDDALRAFQSSLAALPSPNTRLYVARCLREKGQIASAYAMFRVTSREAEDRVRATGDKRYAATQKSAAIEADRLDALVPRVTLKLQPSAGGRAADTEGASISIDGASVSRAELAGPVELDPGAHEVTVSGAHLERSTTRITVDVRDTKSIAIPVKRAPFGSMRIVLKTRPSGLAVELDGEPLDLQSATEKRDVTVGRHRVAARAPGYVAFGWQADVADESSVDVTVDLVPAPLAVTARPIADTAPGPPKWLFFATAGAAALTLGAGAFLVADASARQDEEESKAVSSREPDARDDVRSRAQIGSGLLIGGGVLAVTATVLAVTTRWRKSSTPSATITFGPQATGRQLVLGGAF